MLPAPARAPGPVLHPPGELRGPYREGAIVRTWLHRTSGAALLALLLAQPAAAQQNRVFTLKDLYELCKSTDAQRQSTCTGFVAGARHTLDLFKNSFKDRISYCIPAQVTNGQFKEAFLAWAEKNRGDFERSAARGVARSAIDRYPCNKTGKQFEL